MNKTPGRRKFRTRKRPTPAHKGKRTTRATSEGTSPAEDWELLARNNPNAFVARVQEAITNSRVAVANHIKVQYQRLNRLNRVMDTLEVEFNNPEFLQQLSQNPVLAMSVWKNLSEEVSRITLNLMNINKVMIGIQRMGEVSEDFRRRIERVSLPSVQSKGDSAVAEIVDEIGEEDRKDLKKQVLGRLRELLESE